MKSKLPPSELLALIALALIVAGLPLAVLGYQFALRPALAGVRTVDIVAAAPERGGFQPDTLRFAAGEPVRLRVSASDVTHGLALGPGLGLDFGQLDPGQVKEVELTFDRPGRYTLYCNTWCSPNHWRMRATIEVYDPANPGALPPAAPPDPVVESLAARGVDIDAPHEAVAVPADRPSAGRGAEVVRRMGDTLPLELTSVEGRQTVSPADAYARLVSAGLAEGDAWDAVAYLWLGNVESVGRQTAASLYAKNCAACHGQSGEGGGPGASALTAQGITAEPAPFNNPQMMLGGSSDLYYAKIRRGGMGTGMPGFGPLFTPAETWALVDYLWAFVLLP